ncbi:Altered inheritance of mitochondria protein 18 mitochondrial [Agyrium rufum]|nr:Altered inheritance of mitochondria protein 18 mitochondrial [Agyrium rufum]
MATRTSLRLSHTRQTCPYLLHQTHTARPSISIRSLHSSTPYRKPSLQSGRFRSSNHGFSSQPSIDSVGQHRSRILEVREAKRRMKFAGVGMLMCLAGILLTIQFAEIPESLNKGKKQLNDGPPMRIGNLEPGTAVVGGVSGGAEIRKRGAEGTAPGSSSADDDDNEDDETKQRNLHINDVETGTSHVPYFPKTITLPRASSPEADPSNTPSPSNGTRSLPYGTALPSASANVDEYTLLGHGIRTVSFLRIQVYVVGLYIRTADLSLLQQKFLKHAASSPNATTLVAGEKDVLRQDLLDGAKGEKIWEEVLKEGGFSSALRIVPTRSTDLAHLRDGWVRGVTARAGARAKAVTTTMPMATGGDDFEDERFGESMQIFKSVFGGAGKKGLPKGKTMLIERDGAGVMKAWMERQGQEGGDSILPTAVEEADGKKFIRLGEVRDERISRLVWLGYLGGKTVASEGARKSVVEGVVDIVSRPVGSIETRVL